MTRHAIARFAGVASLALLMVLSTGVAPALGASFAARASVTPRQVFVGDSSGTLLTFTVRNTGTRKGIGAVQISRPFSFWQVLSCPSAPAGWSAVATPNDCQYLSQPGAADDIAHGASATFTLVATTAPSISNRDGTWRVVVSQTNDFAQPSLLKEAGTAGHNLRTRAFSFELTDIVVAAAAATVGGPCPASNHAASGTSDVTLVACGVNHTNAAQQLRPHYAHLGGTLIAAPGTFHGGSVASSPTIVVLGNWSGVDLYSGSAATVTAKLGASASRTSPMTLFSGYETPPQGPAIAPDPAVEGAKDGSRATFIEHLTNTSSASDSYSLSASGSWTATVYDATCTTPISSTPTLATGASIDVCVKVDVPVDAVEGDTNDTTLTATSTSNALMTSSATLTTLAAQFDTLLVDGDTNSPGDSAPYYEDALDANGVEYGYWDLAENATIPQSFLNAHTNVIWFTGNSESGPLSSYEAQLTGFLDGGGRLLMSGQDILDGAAGTSTFVQDYLHISWDGTEVQNDKATTAVHSVDGNPVTNGIGDVLIDHSVLASAFEDEITPIAPAEAAYTDDNDETNALTVAEDAYKIAFLAFPFEAYGTAAQKADLINRVLTWFGT